ncbi:hypothetical protein [Paenibacillus sp. J23TS9]|uniref:hypothetical protein n=1 Tax=Paenibacillus sp. J23TS9 TaxID=2807193 RepID=UPI001BCDBAAF|nr:hypothetical protein [Paenibacillus sp. J23TS9]
MKVLDNGLKTETWSPERLAAHLKAIGADKPPAPKGSDLQYEITAPRKGYSGRYIMSGGEY